LILDRIRDGNAEARQDLFRLLYDDLRRAARRLLNGEQAGHTLQATALVNEAAIRLLPKVGNLSNRRHFFGAAIQAMRRILVDYARQRLAQKRGKDPVRVDRTDFDAPGPVSLDPSFLVGLNDAVEQLRSLSTPKAETFELWYFGGQSTEQIAQLTERSQRAVQLDLKAARAWLYGRYQNRDS
jgi:RNA polymerase sigma factor (TIGR02999 family)